MRRNMNYRSSLIVPVVAVISINFLALVSFSLGADSASELAAGLRAKREGSTYVRVRMETAQKQVLQLQIKSRVSGDQADIVYQVLFPKERKGEAVLLHHAKGQFSGSLFTPPNSLRPIISAQLSEPLFGSDLSYQDIIDDPFSWDHQAIVGSDMINGTSCQILESKPNKGAGVSYSSVRTWADPKRLVPLRIEKYDGAGKLVRRITTTRVIIDGHDSLPANLSVRGPSGTTTEIDGSRIKRGVTFNDKDFTPDGLKELGPAAASSP